jgi:hypothetical protein
MLECIAGEGNTKNQALKKIDEIRKDTGVEKKMVHVFEGMDKVDAHMES